MASKKARLRHVDDADNTITIEVLDPEKGPWLAECDVCGTRTVNGCGSSSCCGSIQFIVTDEKARVAHGLPPVAA